MKNDLKEKALAAGRRCFFTVFFVQSLRSMFKVNDIIEKVYRFYC